MPSQPAMELPQIGIDAWAMIEFAWDTRKEATNVRKHGVDFHEASTAFEDPLALTISDDVHSTREQRYILLGRSHRGRLLVVVHTDRGRWIRIISAREAAPRERRSYEQGL